MHALYCIVWNVSNPLLFFGRRVSGCHAIIDNKLFIDKTKQFILSGTFRVPINCNTSYSSCVWIINKNLNHYFLTEQKQLSFSQNIYSNKVDSRVPNVVYVK